MLYYNANIAQLFTYCVPAVHILISWSFRSSVDSSAITTLNLVQGICLYPHGCTHTDTHTRAYGIEFHYHAMYLDICEGCTCCTTPAPCGGKPIALGPAVSQPNVIPVPA